MNESASRSKPLPLGPKPERTEALREAMATVTPIVEDAAARFWDEFAPDGFEGLLRATEDSSDAG